MSETTHGGLFGAAASAGASASRGARKAYAIVAQTDAWSLCLVMFAGILTIVKKNATPDIWTYSMWFGISLGIAALMYEMSSVKRAVTAFWHGRFGAMAWSLAIWAVAFGFSLNQWIGAASENQVEKTNIHQTAFIQSASASKNVSDLEKQLERLQGKHDWTKNIDAPDAYEARIKAAQADAAYEEQRGGCKSKCIAKQQIAASLAAERAIAIDRATTAEEIKAITIKLEDARHVANTTKVETSGARADLIVLTKFGGMSEEGAQLFNGMFSIIAISIFLSYASAMKTFEALRESGTPRAASNFGLRLKRWFCRVFFCREPLGVQIHKQTQIITDRAAAGAVVSALHTRYGGALA